MDKIWTKMLNASHESQHLGSDNGQMMPVQCTDATVQLLHNTQMQPRHPLARPRPEQKYGRLLSLSHSNRKGPAGLPRADKPTPPLPTSVLPKRASKAKPPLTRKSHCLLQEKETTPAIEHRFTLCRLLRLLLTGTRERTKELQVRGNPPMEQLTIHSAQPCWCCCVAPRMAPAHYAIKQVAIGPKGNVASSNIKATFPHASQGITHIL